VQDDDFAAPPEEWKQLEGKRAMPKGILPSVGWSTREPSHVPRCGTVLVATACHDQSSRRRGVLVVAGEGGRSAGRKVKVDYREEHQRDKSNESMVNKSSASIRRMTALLSGR
jgi:hypothetical protein